MDRFVAFARGDRSAAAEKYTESAEYLRAYSIDTTPEVFTECVRAFMRLGARDRAETYRDLDAATDSVQTAAHARNVMGLLEPDPARAVALLREAVAEFERLEMRVFAARAMVDLGRAMVRAGDDPLEISNAPATSSLSATRGSSSPKSTRPWPDR